MKSLAEMFAATEASRAETQAQESQRMHEFMLWTAQMEANRRQEDAQRREEEERRREEREEARERRFVELLAILAKK